MILYQILPNGVYGGAFEFPDSPYALPGYTFSSPLPIPAGHYAYMDNGWKYAEGTSPGYTQPPIDYAAQNKDTAQALLSATDWTCTVDINNPQYSNPYLGNQDAFLAYRSTVRQTAVNPPSDVAVTFPDMPEEVWVTVPTDTPPA